MTPDPRLRASDEDRDRTATLLREHHAAGRLDPEEFSERLDRVYEAKTMGQLDELMADLPAIDLYKLPDAGLHYGPDRAAPPARPASGRTARRSGRRSHWRGEWGSWLSVTLILIVVWVLSGAGYPWFLWPAGIWGAVLLASTATGALGGHDHGRGLDEGHHGELPGRDPDR